MRLPPLGETSCAVLLALGRGETAATELPVGERARGVTLSRLVTHGLIRQVPGMARGGTWGLTPRGDLYREFLVRWGQRAFAKVVAKGRRK